MPDSSLPRSPAPAARAASIWAAIASSYDVRSTERNTPMGAACRRSCDHGSIEVGVGFVEVIKSALSRCVALVALIGPKWLTVTAKTGTSGLTILRLHAVRDPDSV